MPPFCTVQLVVSMKTVVLVGRSIGAGCAGGVSALAGLLGALAGWSVRRSTWAQKA